MDVRCIFGFFDRGATPVVSVFARCIQSVLKILAVGLVLLQTTVAADLTPVRVQLKWFHQYQFAGFYVAQSHGYFEQAGLSVELIEGGPSLDPVNRVLAGHAEFGVGNSSLVLDYQNGKPVVLVAAIFQHSPFVIIAREDAGINTVNDLVGKSLMGETHAAELLVYLKSAGLDLSKVNFVPHTGDIRSLQPDQQPAIHAATAYISTEPFQAMQADIAHKVFSPRDLEIDFYGDALFTTREYADANPEVVLAMRNALIKGWKYARQYPNEVVNDILANYPTRKDRLALTFEAHAINGLLNDEMVELGYVSLSRLQKISSLMNETGLTTGKKDLNNLMFQPATTIPEWVVYSIIALVIITVISMIVAMRFQQLNRQRIAEICHRKILEKKLIEQARTDPLTGLANRRRFREVADHELANTQRHQRLLGLMIIDLDNFKSINDEYGHHFGDLCLQALANACEHSVRAGDLAARLGGDEFILLLPNASQDAAEGIKTRLEEYLMSHPVKDGELGPKVLSISVGIALWQPEDRSLNDTYKRADQNMYRNKKR